MSSSLPIVRHCVRNTNNPRLMALIELTDSALSCAHLVICVDRNALPEEAATLMKGLQWAGFSLTTLDTWAGGEAVDVTSSSWLYMGMEL